MTAASREDSLWERLYSQKGFHPRVPIEVARRWKQKGHLPANALCFDVETYGFESYVSDRGLCDIHPVNGWFSKLIDDKRFIPILFRAKPHLLPELSIGIEGGHAKFVFEHGCAQDCQGSLASILERQLRRFPLLFVKPAGLSGGRGAFLLDATNLGQSLSRIDERHAYLVNEGLVSQEYARRIYPAALSSLRIHAFRSPRGLRILNIIHKFGTGHSGIVDNLGAGGVACPVDPGTGRLTSGWTTFHTPTRVGVHPDSKAPLVGTEIPEWQQKCEVIAEVLDTLCFVDFIGCDLAVTDKGLKVLEVNSRPSTLLMQLERPALLDEEFARFLASKGYRVA